MDTKTKKVVFADLDGTLIETVTGHTHPKGVWDVKLKLDTFQNIQLAFPKMKYLFVVTNQGGIEKGIVNPEMFEKKLEWVLASLFEYMGGKVRVGGVICPTNDETYRRRKPNPGMLEDLIKEFQVGEPLTEMVMIGDASGKEGDFSDSDKKTAENLGIDYIDVRDLGKEVDFKIE